MRMWAALCVSVLASLAPGARAQLRPGAKEQTPVAVTGHAATTCGGRLNVGYRIQGVSNGVRAAVWYPTLTAETSFQYPNGLSTAMAEHAPAATCGTYPLVVFSHGYTGCGTQSAFFTEELARHGYIVVAPDHRDATCRVDRARDLKDFKRPEEPFQDPASWSDRTYADRRSDVESVIQEILSDRELGPRIDANRIGVAGHSLGGYTAMGLAGGWDSWRDRRIRAVLLFSPFATPYLNHQSVGGIRIPVMYQGGTRDLGITPSLKKPGGAYDASHPPKFFVEFNQVGHLDFSVVTCRSFSRVADCAQGSAAARLINSYGIGFFDRYLKGEAAAGLEQKQAGVAELRFQVH